MRINRPLAAAGLVVLGFAVLALVAAPALGFHVSSLVPGGLHDAGTLLLVI